MFFLLPTLPYICSLFSSLSLVSVSSSSLCWGRWCWAEFQQASGGPIDRGSTAEAQVAGSSGIHTQPWRGRPHLGQNWGHPTTFRQAALPGASWHPTQHEATGESTDCSGQALRPGVGDSGARLLSLCLQGAIIWLSVAVLVTAPISVHSAPQLWMRLSGALQKKRNSEMSYRDIVKNSSNDETIAAKQVGDSA